MSSCVGSSSLAAFDPEIRRGGLADTTPSTPGAVRGASTLGNKLVGPTDTGSSYPLWSCRVVRMTKLPRASSPTTVPQPRDLHHRLVCFCLQLRRPCMQPRRQQKDLHSRLACFCSQLERSAAQSSSSEVSLERLPGAKVQPQCPSAASRRAHSSTCGLSQQAFALP